MAELLKETQEAAVWHASWQELAESVERVDLLCVDAPYSERTHAGHDDAAEATRFRPEDERRTRVDKRTGAVYAVGKNRRRKIEYECWSKSDVDAFVDVWAPSCDGWFVSLTDHVLAPLWESALERHGRYVFSPISCVEPGSRVRISGDGPSQWSVMAVVARPKSAQFSRWGALPGAYVLPRGQQNKHVSSGPRDYVTGGKPLWLMERLVEDYSRPGDLVCDPCAGGFTTMTAALRTGRRFVGGDMKLEHAQMGVRALEAGVQRPLFGGAA